MPLPFRSVAEKTQTYFILYVLKIFFFPPRFRCARRPLSTPERANLIDNKRQRQRDREEREERGGMCDILPHHVEKRKTQTLVIPQ